MADDFLASIGGAVEQPHDGHAVTWGTPVYSPAAGVVELTQNGVPDNPLGVCNFAQAWGNFVIIRLDQGNWAALAHFRQGTVAVVPGARVEVGTYLGQIGNSGRSPVPHLHVQAQTGPQPGSSTLAFRLANYSAVDPADRTPGRWNAWGVPREGDLLCGALPSETAWVVLTSLAPGRAVWSVEVEGRVPRAFRPRRSTEAVRISLDDAGNHIFRSSAGGLLAARMDPDAWRIDDVSTDASRLLQYIALGTASVPYAASPGLTWSDVSNVVPFSLSARLSRLLSPYFGARFGRLEYSCRPSDPTNAMSLSVVAHVRKGSAVLPFEVATRIDRIRGPTLVEACFARGVVRYRLISFEPLSPIDAGFDRGDPLDGSRRLLARYSTGAT